MEEDRSPLLRCCRPFADGVAPQSDDFLLDASGVEKVAAACAGVLAPHGDEQRAAQLLSCGAPLVFVGAAALGDSNIIRRLVASYGPERVGVVVAAARRKISWSFEIESNADFKTVAPSSGEAALEVLDADGAATGVLLVWWLQEMRNIGAAQFVVRADIRDDADLNICADLVERLGDALWLGPLHDEQPPLAHWLEYAGCRRWALPVALHEQVAATQQAGAGEASSPSSPSSPLTSAPEQSV